MTIEKMNAGSVQNWLDKEALTPHGPLGFQTARPAVPSFPFA